MMDSKDRIKKYHTFLEQYYSGDIRQILHGQKEHLEFNLEDFLTFDIDLYEIILEYPERELNLIKSTLINFTSEVEGKDIKVLFTGLSESHQVNLSYIRNEHLGKLVTLNGMIKRKSSALSKTVSKSYLCTSPSCSCSEDKIIIPQAEILSTLKACPRCRSSVEEIEESRTDFIQIYLEELSDELENSNIMPESRLIEIYGDLTRPDFISKFLVGSKIEVIGIIKEKNKTVNGKNSNLSNFYIEALNIISREENINEITISERDRQDFIQLSKQEDIKQILVDSVAPNIAGRKEIKLATLCYIVGGSQKDNQKDLIHLLTVGNASLGKSQILKRLKKLLPRAVYVSGENSSAVGLVGAAVKDEFTGGWTVDAGAMAHANNGYFLLDEFDKIRREDQTKLNEALEHGECSITKAGIRATLKTYAPTYAVANPKYGKFDETKEYSAQLTFDKTLLSRFDLVFILDGKDNDRENEDIIDLILEDKKAESKILDTETLRKYLTYAKSLNPSFPVTLKTIVKNYFIKIQNKSKQTNSIDITYRQLTALIRLSEAITKLRLSTEVTNEDVVEAIELMNHTLTKFSLSEQETGMSNKSRSLLLNIENAFIELDKRRQPITIEALMSELQENGVQITMQELERKIEQMKRESEIFEPRKGIYKRL